MLADLHITEDHIGLGGSLCSLYALLGFMYFFSLLLLFSLVFVCFFNLSSVFCFLYILWLHYSQLIYLYCSLYSELALCGIGELAELQGSHPVRRAPVLEALFIYSYIYSYLTLLCSEAAAMSPELDTTALNYVHFQTQLRSCRS